ncbi:hypothetical protein QEZ47_00050 [Aminobacter anthyllidis]|uniref:NACHT domain-containing protein n=1 Tax=Aminobacter anthyllidis TaxID=1035067 RepID=UPI002455394C|nr:hypothetical protein [Aminobacter anthyllidis]MDH4983973.1 hypothetical protein [Aminobacter anthyllidis]
MLHRIVKIEYPLKSTTADVYFVDQRSQNFPTRIAVECKDWQSPLNSRQLAEIDNLYRPSINGDEIDYLWIVSNHELAQGPSQTVTNLKRIVYSTYQDFLSSVMNFSLVLEENIAAFKNHESNKNFLHLEAKDRAATLEETTKIWLNGDSRALIIFGGYGLGKTSFSFYIASALSAEYQDGTFDRIPIRISLSGLYAKQDLKGLICSVLTGSEGGPDVGNFSYNLFLRMVHEGLFVLILDGFDEMRHAMTAEEFAYTFEQMSPLFAGHSKTIVLGRPDSFFSDDEEEQILSSLFSEIDSPESDVTKIEVSPLRRDQIESYLAKFAGGARPTARPGKPGKTDAFEYDEDEIDILSRPVQLQMFTKIVRQNMMKMDGKITRHRLYSHFIYEFIKREQAKNARKVEIGEATLGHSDPRSIFMQNVAWWVLVDKRENRFSASEIPHDLVPPSLVTEGKTTGSLREALVGSVIERISRTTEAVGTKGGSVYYFPHKSYLEFLVAEYFCRERFSREMFAKFFRNANREIISFLNDGPAEAVKNVRQGLEFVRGSTPRDFFKVASRHPDYNLNIDAKSYPKLSAAEVLTLYELHLSSDSSDTAIDQYLYEVFRTATSLPKFYAALQIMCEHLNHGNRQRLLEKIIGFTFDSLDEKRLADMYSDQSTLYHVYTNDIAAVRSIFLANCVSINNGSIEVNLRRVWSLANDIARSTFLVSDYELDQDGIVTYAFDGQSCEDISDRVKLLIVDRVIARVPLRISGNLANVFSR